MSRFTRSSKMLNLVLVNKLQNNINIMSSTVNTENLTQDINYDNNIETGK
jgi:hypothetical protein